MENGKKPPEDSISVKFNHKEVAEALIKAKGIREGIWAVGFEILQKAATVNHNGQAIPAAVNMIVAVVLSRVAEENNLTANASKIASRIILAH